MLKLSSLKPSKYTHWIFASIGRFVSVLGPPNLKPTTGYTAFEWGPNSNCNVKAKYFAFKGASTATAVC